jgi:hypothetical protein
MSKWEVVRGIARRVLMTGLAILPVFSVVARTAAAPMDEHNFILTAPDSRA